jgi:hypothetical protein
MRSAKRVGERKGGKGGIICPRMHLAGREVCAMVACLGFRVAAAYKAIV